MKKFEKHFFDYLIWKTLAKPFKRAAACIYKSIQCRAIMFWKCAKNRPFLGRKSCPDIWGSRTPYNWPGGLIIDFPQYFYLIEGSWELERFLRGSRTQCVHLPRNEPYIFIYTTIIHMQWYIIMYVRLHINYHIYICIYIYIYIFIWCIFFSPWWIWPHSMKRNVGYLQAGYPVLTIRSRIPAPGYPIPDTRSRIPDSGG